MRALVVGLGLFLSQAARADCYDDVLNSYDCTYAWDASCDEAIAACDAAAQAQAAEKYNAMMSSAPYNAPEVARAAFIAAKGSGWRTVARRYYMTKSEHSRFAARQACADGFHWASFSEIASDSLLYDLELGQIPEDGSWGAPSSKYAHILDGELIISDYVDPYWLESVSAYIPMPAAKLSPGGGMGRLLFNILNPSTYNSSASLSGNWEFDYIPTTTIPVWCVEN